MMVKRLLDEYFVSRPEVKAWVSYFLSYVTQDKQLNISVSSSLTCGK